MRQGLPAFRSTELAIHRICEKRGWERKRWDALDDAEQFDLLAFDKHQRDAIQDIINRFANAESALTPEVYAILAKELV